MNVIAKTVIIFIASIAVFVYLSLFAEGVFKKYHNPEKECIEAGGKYREKGMIGICSITKEI